MMGKWLAGLLILGGAHASSPLLKYETLQKQTCARVVPHVPVLSGKDADNFMAAYQKFNGTSDEAPVLTLADKLLSSKDVTKFLGLPDSFQAGGLDADMVQCAVLASATPQVLADFAVQGKAEEALVDKLLADTLLMRDMLVAGGATGGLYGQAMSIYQQLLKASDVLVADQSAATPWDNRTQDKQAILYRLALGTAVELALPMPLQYKDPDVAPWGPGGPAPNPAANGTVDPIARYLHYEKAYLAGDLDPYFEVFTAFEYRNVISSPSSDADLLWTRETMANFRPEDIAWDYSWRYDEAVHKDVGYGHPACEQNPGICSGRYAQIPAVSGECGPRAFFSRHVRRSWGMPVYGFTQPGHAAMSHWEPEGWNIRLGATWQFNYWRKRDVNQGGEDFHLSTQCRELRPQFQQVLRGGWAAHSLNETLVNPAWSTRDNHGYGEGGLWSALMLYSKKLTVGDGTSIPPRSIGPSVVPTKVAALIARWNTTVPTPTITTDAAGTITIPAVAFTFKSVNATLFIYKSYDAGEQLVSESGNYKDPAQAAFGYEVEADEAGLYYLTVNHTTWHINQDLRVSTNTSATSISVPVYYTVGYWNETQPIAVKLLKGTNVLTFTRATKHAVVFKDFKLYTKEPSIPAPPANYTPVIRPPENDYIEESASTSCLKQGISEVLEQFCGDACDSMNLTYSGAKPTMNISGCFVLKTGQDAGACSFNSNASASCAKPPCTVNGATVAQLCVRK